MRFKKFNKKAQIGETMTWMVATLVIIVILAISIFIVSVYSRKGGKTSVVLPDKAKRFVAVKSITGFVSNENNLNQIFLSIDNNNYGDLKKNMKKFFNSLAHFDDGFRKWNFKLEVNGKQKLEVLSEGLGHSATHKSDEIIFPLDKISQGVKLIFWETCDTSAGGCR